MESAHVRIMISAGGTGGGVYPALAVAEALHRLFPDDLTLTFVGARGDIGRNLVRQADVPFDSYHEVLAGPLHGLPRHQQMLSGSKIALGVAQALALVLRLRPQVLFLTGGWVGVPMALACWLLRRPIVIYVPDIEPGLMLKTMGRYFARAIAATVADTAQFYPPTKRVVETGYPLRRELLEISREDAIQALELDPARKTLLVFGGSRGARSINAAMFGAAATLVRDKVQILHISGRRDWDFVRAQHAQLGDDVRAHYRVFDFLPHIGPVFAAADLVISRAGAATLAEYPLFGLPAILVPYPHAWRYQRVNADWLAERGAAIRLDDERLQDTLLPTVQAVLNDDIRLTAMRQAAHALRRIDGAENIARLLALVAGCPMS